LVLGDANQRRLGQEEIMSAANGRNLDALVGHLPTEFRGCQWNDGLEFDAPCVVYYPRRFRRYGYGGNTGAIDDMVDEICYALACENKPTDGGLAQECAWRGWGPRFDRTAPVRYGQEG